jgi:transcriptional regulator with XRE-family HTH domain
MNQLSGEEFKRLRKELGWGQKEVGLVLHVSQAVISQWENGRHKIPEKYAIQLLGEWAKQKGGADPRQPRVPRESSRYTMPSDEFHSRWERSLHKARELTLEAVFWPSEKAPGFADAEVIKHYRGLVAQPEPFYDDILGLPPPRLPEDAKKTAGIIRFDFDQASDVRLNEREDFRADKGRARCTVLPTRDTIGPHALAFEISHADGRETIQLRVDGDRAVRTGPQEGDAVGIAVYEGLAVESITVHLTCIDLIPDPDPPTAEVYLLRRTGVRSCPAVFDPDPMAVAPVTREELKVKPEDRARSANTKLHYSFGPLLRPVPGFGYCIAWEGLILRKR